MVGGCIRLGREGDWTNLAREADWTCLDIWSSCGASVWKTIRSWFSFGMTWDVNMALKFIFLDILPFLEIRGHWLYGLARAFKSESIWKFFSASFTLAKKHLMKDKGTWASTKNKNLEVKSYLGFKDNAMRLCLCEVSGMNTIIDHSRVRRFLFILCWFFLDHFSFGFWSIYLPPPLLPLFLPNSFSSLIIM